jgi:hypothetical protein
LPGFCDPANDLLGPADRFTVEAAGDLLLAATAGRFFSRVQLPADPAHDGDGRPALLSDIGQRKPFRPELAYHLVWSNLTECDFQQEQRCDEMK